ncbi:NAD(P)-binding protein [Gyrodon lividus]|nr:NAD(P)-binding protein [Gyrodon lividus]
MPGRVVAVFGATGTQGSSVVKTLLADGTFTPRAVTRNPNSDKALKLQELGAEVVQADLWDVPSLKIAMNGVEAVFGVTDYYDPKNSAQGHTSEMLLGKNLVDVAVESNIKFFVWSSLPHSTRVSNGKYPNIYHFDNKANVEEYLRDSKLPHSIVHTGFYNYLTLSPESSSYEFNIPKYDPNSPQYLTWVERDLGQCVLALLKNYEDSSAGVLDGTFYAVSDKLSYTEYAAIIQRGTYEFQSEFGLYSHTPIPDRRLERLGVKFNSMETFAQEELKRRYA